MWSLLLLVRLVLHLLLLILLLGSPLLLLLSLDSLGVQDCCSVYNTTAVPHHIGRCDSYWHVLRR
jgi:hypothetical protein